VLFDLNDRGVAAATPGSHAVTIANQRNWR
jgi:hypothetical protein